MEIVSVNEIASMKSGVHLRSDGGKDIAIIQGKYFDRGGELSEKIVPSLSKDQCPEQFLLKDKDILVVVKGSKFFATLYRSEFGPCIPSTAFVRLRVTTDKVLPEYLMLTLHEALRSPYFNNRMRGTSMLSLSPAAIREYKLKLPSIDQQQKIINLSSERRKQIDLYDQLIEKKYELIHTIILSSSSQ